MSDINTIKRLEYVTFEQFVEDINRNFAIIENSPLYKGIPGSGGLPGTTGLIGQRGTQFLFVDYDKFNTTFPNELTIGSDINIPYINSKLTNQDDREKLFEIFNVTSFVDKDIIVLSDSSMIYYNAVNDSFVDSGVAFNAETNLEANINTIIERYVQFYINNNETLNSVSNIFSSYQTLGKNYSDSNSSFVTNQLLNSTVYSPFITGFNTQNGISINNHKYFGFSDSYFPLQNDGTFVLGSQKRMYQLLMSTISTDANQSLSSDYAPGVNNIPSLVILQDTYNNGILIGYKNKSNLKRFGSIYKNASDDLVIKSDSGKLVSEYSELKINRQYLKFDKLVQFGDTLEVSRNLSVFGEINQKQLKSGIYSSTQNDKRLDIGVNNTGYEVSILSRDIITPNFKSVVFVTDSTGKVTKNYSIETSTINTNEAVGLTQITNIPTTNTGILTSNYYAHLARKFNSLTTYINTTYWTKANFEQNIIPLLKISDTVNIGKILTVGSNSINSTTGVISFVGTEFNVSSTKASLTNYKSKVLITNANGLIENKYYLASTNNISFNNTSKEFVLSTPTNNFQILTNENLNVLGQSLINFQTWIKTNYWNRNNFTDNSITNLYVNNLLKSKDIEVTNYLLTNNSNISIGYGTNISTSIDSTTIRFSKFINKVLVTNENGTLVQTYGISPIAYTNTYTTSSESLTNKPTITTSGTVNNNDLIKVSILSGLKTYVDNTVMWVDSTYWRKGHWSSGSIPTLVLNNLLSVTGNTVLGGSTLTSNANLISNGNATTLGRTGTGTITTIRGGVIKFDGRTSKVLVTDSTGTISNNYTLDASTPTSSDSTGVSNWFDHDVIKNKFWKKGVVQTFQNFQTSANSILTGLSIDWLVGHLKAIRELLYDRPTFAEVNNFSPIGAIVMWDSKLNPNIPDNYVICDGRLIPGTSIRTTNMIGRNPKFVASNPGQFTGNANNKITLTVDQLPTHTVKGYTQNAGDHYHQTLVNTNGGYVGPPTASTAAMHQRRNGDHSENYALSRPSTAMEPTIGKSSTSGSHQHYFESNPIGQSSEINIESANVTVIPIMRYK